MLTSADARRRWFGALFIVLAGGMLIWGQTVLKSSLRGGGFLIYWLVCFGFTSLAMVVALLDIRAVRKRVREEQHHLFNQAFDGSRELAGKSKASPIPTKSKPEGSQSSKPRK